MNSKILVLLFCSIMSFGQSNNDRISLNGTVEFEQTQHVFPPEAFTRRIPVPGLIDLAIPKIEQYDAYFSGTHQPRYSWYKFNFDIHSSNKNRFGILKILKSRYNTQIIINGHDAGTYMQCNTPIDCDITPFLNYNESNILLIRLGERAWLPKEAATGFDREKFTDIPGIWDDVFIEFSGPIKIHRVLALPRQSENKLNVKIQLENYARTLERNMEYSDINYKLVANIREKESKKIISTPYEYTGILQCQNAKELIFDMDIPDGIAWSPESPFLYELLLTVTSLGLEFHNYGNKELIKPIQLPAWANSTDTEQVTFGLRDFESIGKAFYLNGKEYNLFGSTITLNRFFEDRDRAHLPWNKDWVEKLFISIPKALKWNFFRVSIGILPEFWYDLADKHGILIQNEYLMWNLRGRPSQYKKEYTDWIWSDGNHPSIVIWDALNEQKQEYIGTELIPELKKLDHTRIWDLGYMKSESLGKLEVNEIHWYPLAHGWWVNDEWYQNHIPTFRFGKIDKKYAGLEQFKLASTPIIVNEYGWLWQNRDGMRSSIRTAGEFTSKDVIPYRRNYEYYEVDGTQLYENRDIYDYFLGEHASKDEREVFQAYMLSIETEILRCTGEADGIASFSYLSNDKGHTGDWFAKPIKDLVPTQTLLAQYHSFHPFAAFLNVEDGRYLKNPSIYKHEPYPIELVLINDTGHDKNGTIILSLINNKGETVWKDTRKVQIENHWQKTITIELQTPKLDGAYLLKSELLEEGSTNISQVSLRYINVGKINNNFYNYQYKTPNNWPK